MSLKASSQWIGGERFVTEASSGHALVVDADRESDTASSPLELVLMGLCSCTSVDVVGILQKKRLPVRSVDVTAEAERADDYPRVFTRIHMVFRVEGVGLPAKAVEDAVRLSSEKYCSVSRMLEQTAAITREIIVKEPEPA